MNNKIKNIFRDFLKEQKAKTSDNISGFLKTCTLDTKDIINNFITSNNFTYDEIEEYFKSDCTNMTSQYFSGFQIELLGNTMGDSIMSLIKNVVMLRLIRLYIENTQAPHSNLLNNINLN